MISDVPFGCRDKAGKSIPAIRRSDLAEDGLLVSFHGMITTSLLLGCWTKDLCLCPARCFMEEGIKHFYSLVMKVVVILVQSLSFTHEK